MKIPANANFRSPYPNYFMTPEGRPVSFKKLGVALRTIRRDPDADYPGWNWFPTPGHFILRVVQDGINDRINKRAELGRLAREQGRGSEPLSSFYRSLAA